MKKLLTFLMSLSVVSSSASSLVACYKPSEVKDESYKEIGKDIDTSKAVDDGIKDNKVSKYTNYYVLGDSLSDVDGVTTYLRDYLSSGSLPLPGLDKIKWNVSFDDYLVKDEKGQLKANNKSYYGFTDASGVRRSTFTNELPAAAVLGQKLGFKDIYGSSFYTKNYINDKLKFGNNYAIGGATAVEAKPADTDLVNKALQKTSIENQAIAMIQQHKIGTNDLVVYCIGPNDLMGMLRQKDDSQWDAYIDDMIEAIKNSLYTVLNRGVKEVLFVTPPTLENVPRYKTAENHDVVKELCAKVETRTKELLDSINKNYPNAVKLYDLHSKINDTLTDAASKGLNVDDGFTNGFGSGVFSYRFDDKDWQAMPDGLKDLVTIIGKINQEKPNEISLRMSVFKKDGKTDEDLKKSFFMDDIHPSNIPHYQFADIFKNFLDESNK
ncbi:hypothetical protein SHELI_v1c08970 [Spiroplasma helicoides]|uniref:Lipolytic enzyme, GDSL family n=1 Tax=Spiroplasma helicoides TaxID=216938 RepID=A0A1B3SLN3_9MOLU|nr:SGNH/GDSL hydrolase family protein [Spiroplasma helicoides]AOG60846.1 hypothetical protein SHELI_v1c08970 [Spiroplasma helicoides]